MILMIWEFFNDTGRGENRGLTGPERRKRGIGNSKYLGGEHTVGPLSATC